MANKKVSPLTDTEIKNAKPKEKKYTLPDGNGLQLLIKPDGKRYGRYDTPLTENQKLLPLSLIQQFHLQLLEKKEMN